MISSVETALCTFDFAQLNPGVFQGFARVNLFFSLFLRMLFVFRIAYVLFVCCTLGWKKKFGQYYISMVEASITISTALSGPVPPLLQDPLGE